MADERPPPTYFGAPPRSLAAGAAFAARAAARLRMLAGFAARTARAWVVAARGLVSLRLERRRLERSRATLQYELGGAALAEDAELVDELRGRLRACVGECERLEREARATVAHARSQTAEERSAAARTEIHPRPSARHRQWAILDSNQGPPPYQSGALTN